MSPLLAIVFLVILQPAHLCNGSLGGLHPCEEVKLDPFQLLGTHSTGLKPVDTMLTNPIHYLVDQLIKTLCYGKSGQMDRSRNKHSKQPVIKQDRNKNIILRKENSKSILINKL